MPVLLRTVRTSNSEELDRTAEDFATLPPGEQATLRAAVLNLVKECLPVARVAGYRPFGLVHDESVIAQLAPVSRNKVRFLVKQHSSLPRLTLGDIASLRAVGPAIIYDILNFAEAFRTGTDQPMSPSVSSADHQAVPQDGEPTLSDVAAAAARFLVSSGVRGDDPRFPELSVLRCRRLSLANASSWLQLKSGVNQRDLMIVTKALLSSASRVAEFSAMSVTDEIRSAVRAADGKSSEALLRFIGLDCDRPATLAEAGRMVGVTRERFRQRVNQLHRRLAVMFLPATKCLLSLKLDRQDGHRGATLPEVALPIRRFLDIVEGKRVTRTCQQAHRGESFCHALVSRAKRLCGAYGFCRLSELVELGDPVEPIRTCLVDSQAFVFSHYDPDVCWGIATKRNRLATIVASVLWAYETIDVHVLRHAIERHRRHGRPLHEKVLAEILRFYGYSADDGRVFRRKGDERKPPAAWVAVFSAASQAGGMISHQSVINWAKLNDFPIGSIANALASSPLIRRVARGRYATLDYGGAPRPG